MEQTYSSWLSRRLARPLAALGLLLATAGAAQAQTAPAFAPVALYGMGGNPVGPKIVDINGDGFKDLLTANYNNSTLGVRLGTSTGTLGALATYACGGQPLGLALGDLNGDNKLDVVLANYSGNRVSVLLGTGTGSFGTATQFATGSQPYGVALGDFNGDGKLDAVTANYDSGKVGVLLGTGTGTFGAVTEYGAGGAPNAVAVGDVSSNGQPDVVVTNSNGSVGVLLGTGTGSLGTATVYSLGISSSRGVALGDLNRDGRPDIVDAGNSTAPVAVLLNTGAGVFGAASRYAGAGTGDAIGVALGDVNGDGFLDAAVARNGRSAVEVWPGTGTGTLSTAASFTTDTTSPQDVAIGDLNNDSKPDLVVGEGNSLGTLTNAKVFLNTAVFAAPTLSSISPNPAAVGTSVTLTGTNLGGATAISFNGTAATTFAVVNGTTITATVPTGATTGNVTVTTPSGTSGGVAFTVTSAPTVTTAAATSLTSTSAVLGGNIPTDGGATVTARGVVYSSTNTVPTIGGAGVAQDANGTGTGTFTKAIAGLAPGTTYYVRAYATNSAGTSYGSVVSFATLAPVSGTAVATNVSCNGGRNGAINLTPTGGVAPYTYRWSDGPTTEDRTGLAAGTYAVTITDTNGATGTVSNIIVTQPTALTATTSQTNVTTNGGYNGSATITVGGGTPNYTYSWSPNVSTLATASDLSAGTYSVTATDANGCTITRSFTISQPAAATVFSVTRQLLSPTALPSVVYRVVFSTSVSGVSAGNFTLTTTGGISGASVASVSGSVNAYTVVVNTGTGNGTLRLDVTNSTGISPTITNVPYTAGEAYTITKNFAAAPILRIQAAGSASGTGDVTAFVDVVQVRQSGTSTAVANALQNASFETNNVAPAGFKKTGDGVTADFWSFTGLAGISRNNSAFGSTAFDGTSVALIQSAGDNSASISQNLAVPTGSYQVRFGTLQRNYTSLDQQLNVFVNDVFVGNIKPNNIPTYDIFTSVPFSVTAPALTATVSTTSASPTSTAPIPFAVTFSQSVGSTFTASDVTVSGGTLTSGSFSGSGAGPYTFTVTPSGAGTVAVSLAASVATDANNAPNTASNAVSVQYLLTTPTPILVTPNSGLAQGSRPTFSGIAPAGSTVTLYVAAGSGPAQVIGTTIGTANDFYFFVPTVALAGGTYTTYVTAQLSGQAVSANSNSSTFTVDDTPPTAALTSAAGSATSTSPIPFTVTFSELVTGFSPSGISVSNGTVTSGLTAVGNAYSFSVTPTANGPVTVSVLANAAQDASGNGSTASNSVSVQYTRFIPAPSITVFSPASGPVGTSVSITGNNLGGTTAVSFNGTPASSFVVNSAASITAVVAAGTTTGPVRVSTPGGTATSATSFVVRVAPVTVADSYTTPQGIPLTGNVLSNDLGTNPRAILINRPSNGSLVLNPNGSFTYVPNAGFTGTDSFTYYACDPDMPLLCGNPATVTITVTRVAPTTVADNYTTPAGTPLTGNVLSNDLGTNPRAILINRPTRGVLVLNPNGSFTYTPNTGFVGTDSFTYYACDPTMPLLCGNPATVSITVTRVVPVTVADSYSTPQGITLTGNVLANDLGTNPRAILINRPTRGTLVLNPDGSFSYQPSAGFVGADSFTYYACNTGAPLVCGDPATVSISVLPTNTATRPAAQAATAPAATSAKPAVSAVDGATIALELALTGHPNPFADELQLSFALPIAQAYTLAVYDAQGRLVQQLASGQAEAGQARQLAVPTRTYAAGLYLVRLTTSTGTRQLKLLKQ